MNKAKTNWILIALASVPLMMTLGNSMFIPILPLMEKELSISSVQSSYLITAYSVVAIFCIPIAGFLSDKFGRKRVIIPALIITAIGGLIAGLAASFLEESYRIILMGRILQGIGASGAMPIVIPLVGDLFNKEEASATLGKIETANTAGKVLSPIVGSSLTMLVWYLPFYAIPVLSIISCLLIFFSIDAEKKEESEPIKDNMNRVKKVFQEHKQWLFTIFYTGAVLMFVLFGYLIFLSDVLENKHDFTGVVKGLFLAIPLLALSTTAYITGRLIKFDRAKMRRWSIYGFVLVIVSNGLVSMVDNYKVLLFIYTICSIGIGVILPCLDAFITKTIEEKIRGIVTSFYSAMRFLGVAIGPPIATALLGFDKLYMIAMFIAVSLLSVIVIFKYLKINKV